LLFKYYYARIIEIPLFVILLVYHTGRFTDFASFYGKGENIREHDGIKQPDGDHGPQSHQTGSEGGGQIQGSCN